MKKDTKSFRRVLDLCDQLNHIKERIARHRGEPGTAGEALMASKRERLSDLWGELEGAFARGVLGEVRSKYELTGEELLVISLLLSRRIRRGNKGLSGREILATLYESAYDMVRGMRILWSDGNLRHSGIVAASDAYQEDVFEAHFRLCDDVFYQILFEISDQSGAAARTPQRPFSSSRGHLIEMGRLTTLYRKRASVLFPVEAQDFFSVEGDISLDEVEYRIEAAWSDIEGRLLLTPEYETYPLVRLERKYALSRRELMIVVSLFFVEMVSPAPYLVVGDLVKLVSRHEEDLMACRLLLTTGSALVKSGIIMLDEEHSVHQKLTTFDAYLADWVVEELAGPGRDVSAITTDVQIDVHEFLKGLSAAGEYE